MGLVHDDRDKEPFCGGTLISLRHVPTSVSCIRKARYGYRFQVALIKFHEIIQSDGHYEEIWEYHPIRKVHEYKRKHPGLDDIAIVEIGEIGTIQEFKPTCLGDKILVPDVTKSDIVTEAGWKASIKVITGSYQLMGSE